MPAGSLEADFLRFQATGRQHRGCIIQQAVTQSSAPEDGRPPLPDYRPATSWVHYTTSCNTHSSAPEDGRDQRPKHVELI